METKIILERHGESMANAVHVYAGHTDFPLSERGFLQAEAAAASLSDVKIDAIYSSDLARACDTALPHANMRGLSIIKSKALREIYLGEWEAAEQKFLHENYPYEARFIWNNYFGLFRAPRGESAPDAGLRFFNELVNIARSNEGKTVLVTAHAAVIRLAWGMMLGLEYHEVAKAIAFPANTSFSFASFDGEKFLPLRYSVDWQTEKELLEGLKNEYLTKKQ